jgi:hypothetical protein
MPGKIILAWKLITLKIHDLKYTFIEIYFHFFGVHFHGENPQNMPVRLLVDQMKLYQELTD